METTTQTPILIPDAVFEHSVHEHLRQPTALGHVSRRHRWAATALAAVIVVGLLSAAMVIAAAAAVVAAIVFAIEILTRLAKMAAGKPNRTES